MRAKFTVYYKKDSQRGEVECTFGFSITAFIAHL